MGWFTALSSAAAVIVFIGTCWFWYFSGTLSEPASRAQIERWLTEQSWHGLYHDTVSRLLDAIDRALTPNRGPDREAQGRHPWNWPLFDWAMLLAIAYPIFSLLVTWGVRGEAATLGGVQVLPAGDLGTRLAVGAGLAAIVALLGWSRSLSRQAAATDNPDLAERYRRRAFNAGVGAFAVVGAFAGAFAVVGAVAGAVAVAVAGAAVAAFAVAFAGAFAVVGTVAGAGAGAVVGATTQALDWIGDKTRWGSLGYAVLVLLIVAGVTIAARSIELDDDGATILVFLALLPAVNALFDFLSFGLTRLLVRLGVNARAGWAWLFGFADVLAALAFFFALGILLITVVHWASPPGQVPLVHLGWLFADIRTDPWAHSWLFVCLFSTLLPTLLHLLLSTVSGALACVMPLGLSAYCLKRLPEAAGNPFAARQVYAAFTVTCTAATVVFLAALAAILWGLWTLHDDYGVSYFAYLLDYAAWLEAL